MALIVRRNPGFGRGVTPLRRAMDRFFDDSFFSASSGARSATKAGVSGYATLPVDISEHDGDLVVRASVPGYEKDEISVQVEDGVLSIDATHEKTSEQGDEDAEGGERYYRRERRSGSLTRRIALPRKVGQADVDAELANGVLTLTIPTPEDEKPKQIEIKTA
ncbi:MAG: Hsp20/alpha crystallin family protein [Dehalococcoidia bacterium]|jgi:HSP20 family protein|nr:Hsp20/alpha crystallin family protein [Dehalococcoidia bacterium]